MSIAFTAKIGLAVFYILFLSWVGYKYRKGDYTPTDMLLALLAVIAMTLLTAGLEYSHLNSQQLIVPWTV